MSRSELMEVMAEEICRRAEPRVYRCWRDDPDFIELCRMDLAARQRLRMRVVRKRNPDNERGKKVVQYRRRRRQILARVKARADANREEVRRAARAAYAANAEAERKKHRARDAAARAAMTEAEIEALRARHRAAHAARRARKEARP